MDEKKLSRGTKIGFGIGDIGGNSVFTIMAFVVPSFFLLTLGLQPVLAGLAIGIAKVWDAIIDPVMGVVSDRTRTRLGRRRPYLLAGGIFALIAMSVMFFNPHFDQTSQQPQIFLFALIAYCVFCTAYTMFNVPYSALTPDLSADFHEQTSLNSYRMSFAVVGTLLGAGVFMTLVEKVFTPAGSADKSQGFFITGIIFGAIILIVTLVTFFSVREKPAGPVQPTSVGRILKTYLRVIKNKPFRIVLLTYAINLIGITLVSSTMVLYFRYIYQKEDQAQIAMVLLLVVTMIFISVWNLLKKKIEKKVSYAVGLFIIAAATLIVFFFGPALGPVFMFVMMGIAGIGMATTYVAPYAMIPDSIEYDQVDSGKRDEGAYYGLWTFFAKIGQALAGVMIGVILQLTSFVPPQTVDQFGKAIAQSALIDVQVPAALMGIRLLMGPIAALFLVLAGVLVLTYPINEKMYQAIMAKKKTSRLLTNLKSVSSLLSNCSIRT